MRKIRIDNTDIYLENEGENRGKITVSNSYGHNYSYFWGAMGGTIEHFICNINSSYFADKLLGSQSNYIYCSKSTFKNLREFIKTEIGLAWYQHMDFQKDMRQRLKSFEQTCENENDFVHLFQSYFVNYLDFCLINDRWEQQRLEKEFKNICEVWNFIGQKESPNYLWLVSLHEQLKKELQ